MGGGDDRKSSSKNPSSSSSSYRKSPHDLTKRPPDPQKPSKHNVSPNFDPNPVPRSFPGYLAPSPPPPGYGFHMLDRRPIVLPDGTLTSYFALPPNYPHFNPHIIRPLHPPPSDYMPKRKFPQQDTTTTNTTARVPKKMRISDRANHNVKLKHDEVDQEQLKKAFFTFVKLLFEKRFQTKCYLADGKEDPLPCLACNKFDKTTFKDIRSEDYPDTHSLVMHTYNSDRAELLVDHLGLHKALCILMGWNYLIPPDNSKSYQLLSHAEALANQDDLIIWPPMVIIHNTHTSKGSDGRMEGFGNKAMDYKLRDVGFTGCKSKTLYGRGGHLGITLVKYPADQSGLEETLRLADYFERDNRGRLRWAFLRQSLRLFPDNEDEDEDKDEDKDEEEAENNPNLVRVDPTTGEKEKILYGFLGLASDLHSIGSETKKRVGIESFKGLQEVFQLET